MEVRGRDPIKEERAKVAQAYVGRFATLKPLNRQMRSGLLFTPLLLSKPLSPHVSAWGLTAAPLPSPWSTSLRSSRRGSSCPWRRISLPPFSLRLWVSCARKNCRGLRSALDLTYRRFRWFGPILVGRLGSSCASLFPTLPSSPPLFLPSHPPQDKIGRDGFLTASHYFTIVRVPSLIASANAALTAALPGMQTLVAAQNQLELWRESPTSTLKL